ncbi:2'-5' RNA ligase family protein [Nocardia sp. NBC_00416]|uniref:2'-5' RNA ligase family protein n=1 Tax=Nocardia sp. NBC_00416 TaxID=2975991 RepID=UPI002E24788D
MNAKHPFPLGRPSSTAEAAAIRANDWAAFRDLEFLSDHWTTKAWAPGRTGYYWYLTFHDPALADLTQQCQKRLEHDGIDLVPRDGLHVTLLGLGRADQVSDEQLAQITAEASARLSTLAPFELAVGPLTGSRSALRFSVTPWDPLLELHHMLRAATAGSQRARRLAETADFRPHLGIGYISRTLDVASVIGDVAALRALPPVTVRVDSVDLVELRREGRAYRWTDLAVLPLGGTSSLRRREAASGARPNLQ